MTMVENYLVFAPEGIDQTNFEIYFLEINR